MSIKSGDLVKWAGQTYTVEHCDVLEDYQGSHLVKLKGLSGMVFSGDLVKIDAAYSYNETFLAIKQAADLLEALDVQKLSIQQMTHLGEQGHILKETLHRKLGLL